MNDDVYERWKTTRWISFWKSVVGWVVLFGLIWTVIAVVHG